MNKATTKGISLIGILSWVILSLLGSFDTAKGVVVDRIVAVVNGDVITLSELEEKARPLLDQYLKDVRDPIERQKRQKELLAKLLPQLIDEHLIEGEIKKMGIKVPDSEVEATLKRICQENGMTLDELQHRLAKEGYTLEDYKKEIRQQIQRQEIINAQVRSKIVITDQQVMAYLRDQNPELFSGDGPRYVLQHICVVPKEPNNPYSVEAAKKKAKEALKLLKDGKDFAKVAAKYSDVASGEEGVLLGAFTPKEMASFVKDAVLKLKPGQFTEVVKTPLGFQIFRLKAIEQTSKVEVDKTEMDKVRRQLYRKQINARFEQWLQELRSKSTIRILL